MAENVFYCRDVSINISNHNIKKSGNCRAYFSMDMKICWIISFAWDFLLQYWQYSWNLQSHIKEDYISKELSFYPFTGKPGTDSFLVIFFQVEEILWYTHSSMIERPLNKLTLCWVPNFDLKPFLVSKSCLLFTKQPLKTKAFFFFTAAFKNQVSFKKYPKGGYTLCFHFGFLLPLCYMSYFNHISEDIKIWQLYIRIIYTILIYLYTLLYLYILLPTSKFSSKKNGIKFLLYEWFCDF